MPPEVPDAGPAEEWLENARSNLIRARQPRVPGVLWAHLCFDAQQAAEKAVKAVLVHRQAPFPYIHDVPHLLGLVEGTGVRIPDELWNAAAVLTPYAIHGRYPRFARRIDEEKRREALACAEQVVRWAEGIVHGG